MLTSWKIFLKMSELLNKINETVAYIRNITSFEAEVGIIMGSGLSALSSDIDVEVSIPYTDLPNFPVSTVMGHGKELILGTLQGKKVIALTGRFHFYEGYTMKQVTFPVRIMKALGAKDLIVSNASGSTNPQILTGDIVLINDHINFTGDNPLIGPNDEKLGIRFPDMLHTYHLKVNKKVMEYAEEQGIRTHQGTYIGVKGPNLETPAEYKMFHRMGADIVGMSTVPEIIVAVHAGLKVFGISIVCDQGYPQSALQVTTHETVVNVAVEKTPEMLKLVKYALLQL